MALAVGLLGLGQCGCTDRLEIGSLAGQSASGGNAGGGSGGTASGGTASGGGSGGVGAQPGCTPDGEACVDGAECCGSRCSDGTCLPLNQNCASLGNPCTQNDQCCSLLCEGGHCDAGGSFCIQAGDRCLSANDCCSGNCVVETDQTVGICGPVVTGPSNCDAGVSGEICEDCNDCCSRLCIPFGTSGKKICQASDGCRLTGETCRRDADCCGGDADSGLPGAGNVSCFKEDEQQPIGICRNPMSCSPQGSICPAPEFTCSPSAAPNKCCGATGNADRCEVDRLGVPRCNGLQECRTQGETCSSTRDCCSGSCASDQTGALRCRAQDCGQEGDACGVDADCCAAHRCKAEVGSTAGVCVPSEVECAQYGQSCKPGDCCGDVPCTEGRCVVPF